MHDVATAISQTLDFNVSGLFDVLFDKASSIAKGGGGFIGRLGKHGSQIIGRGDNANAATSPTHECLDNDGIMTLMVGIGNPIGGFIGRRKGFGTSGDHGDFGFNGASPCGRFISKGLQIFHRRSDKGNTGFLQGRGKLFIFRQESISWMDGLDLIALTNFHNGGNIQILCHGWFGSIKFKGLIALVSMLREAIFMRINTGTGNAQFGGRS
mmetsp:Transcript_20328/g.42620  ORF Transcript_20328/g.42620 Transcript_20328/m.42620 type:complete len:211 (-) Transcript_20328:453-1085(-)